jgi:hypothetical protein
MPFHRLAAPTYFTGGPTFPSESGVVYDYINNGGSGTPAFADGIKVGTVNAGTYFFSFGEDATSSNFNRAPKALAENCDHLDNLFHRSIATSVRTVDVVAGAPVSSITLPIGTFLGVAGYTTSTADLNRLFEIVDSTDKAIVTSGGVEVKVTSVTLGSGDTIGGGGANGSFSGNTVQLNFATSIPTSTTYRVYYGTRTNLATLPLDALTTITIRNAQETSAALDLFKQALATTTALSEGCLLVGMKALASWANGDTNPAGTISALVVKAIADLAANSASNNEGADRVGFFPSGTIAANTVGDAIRELGLEKAALSGAAFLGPVSVADPQTLTIGHDRLVLSPAITNVWRRLGTMLHGDFDDAISTTNITIGEGNPGRQLIDLPNGTVINGVRTAIDRVNTGTLPGTRFSVAIGRKTLSTGVVSYIVSGTADPTNTLAAYEAFHQFDITFSDITIDNSTYVYWVEVIGELPSNSSNVVWHGSMVRVSLATGSFI